MQSKILFKYNKILLAISILFTLTVPISSIIFAFTIQRVVDAGTRGVLQDLKVEIILCLGSSLLIAITSYIAAQFKNVYVKKTMKKIKDNLFFSIIKQDYTSFQSQNSGGYISLLTNDLNRLEDNYIAAFFDIVRNGSLMIISLIVMFFTSWQLATAVFVACALPILISSCLGKTMQKRQLQSMNEDNNYTTKVKDILSGFLVIKSFNVENQIIQDYAVASNKQIQSKYKINAITAFVMSISSMSSYLVFLTAFGGGFWMAIEGMLSLGKVMAIIQLVNFVIGPIELLGTLVNKFTGCKSILEKIGNNSKAIKENSNKTKDCFNSKLTFNNVEFAYPSNEEKIPVLKNVTFEIEKGKKYAIVGLSGSGKSTLFNLILRFYELEKNKGSIKIDDEDIKDISLKSLYKLITIVQQEVYVFDQSLKENITLGKSFSNEQIERAVKLSGLEDLIIKKQEGLNVSCGENGSLLSGGQKQRLSIARSLIRETPILLMDEATSALDPKTTFEIEKSILAIEELTSMVITHKLNIDILKEYDEIIMINDGKISEMGSFDNLLNKQGDFYKMYQVVNLTEEKVNN